MLSSIIPWCSKLCRFILPKRTKTQIKCTQKRGWNADKNAVKTHTKTRLKCTQNAYENSSKNCQARSLFLQQYFVRAFLKLVSASSEQQERASLNSIQRLLRWNEREREREVSDRAQTILVCSKADDSPFSLSPSALLLYLLLLCLRLGQLKAPTICPFLFYHSPMEWF